MKTVLITIGVACLATVVVSYVTYSMTRTKWYDLGQVSGKISGKAEVMEQLCLYAEKGKPKGEVQYYLDLKASRLSLVKTGQNVTLYCE